MSKKLFRSRQDKMLAGVCAGIAEYFDIDPTIVRLGFAIFVFAYGTGVLAYILCAIIIPERPYDYIEDQTTSEGHDATQEDEHTPEYEHSTQKKTKQIIGVVIVGLGVLMLADQFWIG